MARPKKPLPPGRLVPPVGPPPIKPPVKPPVAAGLGAAIKRPAGDSVAGNVAGVIRQNSPLMKLAETKGLQEANRRGLLSSSIAVGAAQNSVLEAATPIGIAEANQRFQKNLSRQEFRQQKGLANQGLRQQKNLNRQEFLQQKGLAKQNFQQDQALQRRDIQADLRSQKIGVRADSRERGLDRKLQEKIGQWNLDAADKDRVTANLTQYMNTYEGSLAEIMNNDDLSSEQRTAQIGSLNARREKYVNLVRGLWDVDVSWDTPAPRQDRRIIGRE